MPDLKPEPSAKPISELLTDPDFPNSALGQKVDIQGFIGVVMEVVKNSIRVRSATGETVRYNFNALRRLYGPRPAPEEVPIQQAQAKPGVPQAETKPQVILEPDFNSPLVPIEVLVQRPDFPGCAFGHFVDLHGFTGVVIELVGDSLKVRSQQGSSRRYNVEGLRKLYSQLPPSHPSTKA